MNFLFLLPALGFTLSGDVAFLKLYEFDLISKENSQDLVFWLQFLKNTLLFVAEHSLTDDSLMTEKFALKWVWFRAGRTDVVL